MRGAATKEVLRRTGLVGASVALVCMGCLVGLPLELADAAFFWKERDYARVEAFVQRNVQSNDWVCCHHAAYYPAKKRAAALFLCSYSLITPQEKARINVLIIDPTHAREVIESLGGQWTKSPDQLQPSVRQVLRAGMGYMFIENYDLQVWRRVPVPSAF